MTTKSISQAPLRESVPLTDLLCCYLYSYYHSLLFDSCFCLFHICHLFAKERGKIPKQMDFLHKIIDLF